MIIAALSPSTILIAGDITSAWHRFGPVIEKEAANLTLAGTRRSSGRRTRARLLACAARRRWSSSAAWRSSIRPRGWRRTMTDTLRSRSRPPEVSVLIPPFRRSAKTDHSKDWYRRPTSGWNGLPFVPKAETRRSKALTTQQTRSYSSGRILNRRACPAQPEGIFCRLINQKDWLAVYLPATAA